MLSAALLPDIPGLLVEQVIIGIEAVTLVVRMTTPAASCPACGQSATRVHSRSRRTLADLPASGRRVRISLQTRRFFCANSACPRRTFTEQVPLLALPRKQRTLRLQETLRCLGFALGGEAGARLADRLGMPCSPDTLLRLVRETVLCPVRGPRVLGVDDWAVLKGQTYGTILLDLERRVPIDLLPDREEATFAAWLQAHPGVEWISRDRGETYIQGARLGAPDARHVADRWHLLKNVREALQRFLERQEPLLQQVARQTDQGAERAPPPPLGLAPLKRPPRPAVKRPPPVPKPKPLSPQRERQLAMYQQVRDLAAQGWWAETIARHLQIQPKTVRKYMELEQFVDRRHGSRRSQAEPYRAYLEHRWAEGCTDRRQLWHELQARGYTGSYLSVWTITRSWDAPTTLQPPSPPPVPLPRPPLRSPSRVSWLLLQDPADQKATDTTYREALYQACPEIALAAQLARDFFQMVREQQATAFDPWLERATRSGLKELRRFALGLRQDYAAVRAALEEPWSQGPTEGHILRLKLLKRQMYGRAKVDLLRQRVLQRG
jgi:transposase